MHLIVSVFSPLADVRLKKFTEEKNSMKQEIEQLHQQLLEAKTQRRSGSLNGPCGDEDYEDAQSMPNRNCQVHQIVSSKN